MIIKLFGGSSSDSKSAKDEMSKQSVAIQEQKEVRPKDESTDLREHPQTGSTFSDTTLYIHKEQDYAEYIPPKKKSNKWDRKRKHNPWDK